MSTDPGPAPRLVAVLNHPDDIRTGFAWAVSLAREWRLPLTLLHIVDPVTSDELAENARAMAEDMLALLVASPAAAGLDVTTVVESGMTEDLLPAAAARIPGAVFLLAAGGYGAFSRALLRRGRENVIHRLRSPFVFLPPAAVPPARIERALAGIDGSAAAERALEVGRSLLGDTPVVRLEVLEPGSLPVKEYLAVRPSFAGGAIRMRGRAAVAILAAARARDAGLIIVGGHGARGLFGRHLGGTAQWLSQNADRPVLIVPGPMREGGAPSH